MNRRRFEELVAEVLGDIPERFRAQLDNVEVVVEQAPSAELLRDLGLDPQRDALYGLYEGVSLQERVFDDDMALPDRITIFYRPLVRDFRTPTTIRREIRKTVIHEIAHFFGLDDAQIEQDGYA